MAVAVKQNRETKASSQQRQLTVSIILGVLYVLGSLGVIFPLLDAVWWTWLGFDRDVGWSWVGRIAVGLAAAGVLAAVGVRLLGREPMRGLRAGILLGFLGFLLILLLAQWLGSTLEGWFYAWTSLGDSAWYAGVGLTAAIGFGLLAGFGWLISRRGFQNAMAGLEDAGWFSSKGYKPNQGQKVRRGTMLGILILAGTGIMALLHSLEAAGNWTLQVPFSGKVELNSKNVGDHPELRPQVVKREEEIGAWETNRQRALAEVRRVLRLPGGRDALAGEMDQLAAVDKSVRKVMAETQPGSAAEPTLLLAGSRETQLLSAAVADAMGSAGVPSPVLAAQPLAALIWAQDLANKGVNPQTEIAVFKERFEKIKEALTAPQPQHEARDRFQVRDANRDLKENYVKITRGGYDDPQKIEVTKPDGSTEVLEPTPELKAGDVIKESEFEKYKQLREKRKVERPGLGIEVPAKDKELAVIQEQDPARTGTTDYVHYTTITLLPHLKYIAPLLLAALGLWFAWRVVNVPSFSDFLIATEAELNKVSWTTKKRLFQDTVVVLVTVILMTIFLFFADVAWSALLKGIGVLRPGDQSAKQEQQQW